MPQTFNVGSRSLFVTLTAGVFFALAAMASVSGLLQNATLASWLPGLQGLGAAQPLPILTGLLIGYLPWVVGAGLAISLATMASAAGLLMRLEWARRCFIALLGLAIVGQLLSSQMIDHFGLLGAVRRPVSLLRLGGMVFMLIGLAVMLFVDRLSARFLQ